MTTEELPPPEIIVDRLEALSARIIGAGGDLDRVKVIAVTKAFPPELTTRALQAGLVDLGENYAQELVAKVEWLETQEPAAELPGPRWHFIGGLQRNKVKLLAGRVHLWQSIDRASLVSEIAKRSPGDRILIQVNTTGEDQKAGCPPGETSELVGRAKDEGLTVAGLMTVGPTGGADPRPCFRMLRDLAAESDVEELSMGMSADFETAVEEGSTMIRVGSALFGPRPTKPRTTAHA